MQVRLGKLLASSIIFGTFLLVAVHTYFQSNGNIFFNDTDLKIEAIQNKATEEAVLKVVKDREQRIKYKMPVKGEKNIIFLETTCILNSTGYTKENSKLILNNERACAIESTARTNPNASIYLYYSCPLDPESLARSDDIVKMIFDYPNVHFWHQSMDSIFKGSPLENLYTSRQIHMSKYPRTHGSDVLRFLMLWTFGGIYLDLDFIVLRSFDSLGANFVGAENWEFLNSAALGLSSSGLGAEIAQECVDELRTNFRGNDWGYNGPQLITRIMRRRCAAEKTEQMTTSACKGFNVLPPSVFYPIYYEDWRLLYSKPSSRATMPKLTSAVAVHLWNSMKVLDKNKIPVEIERGSKQPIAQLHQKFCPTVNKIMIGNQIVTESSVVKIR